MYYCLLELEWAFNEFISIATVCSFYESLSYMLCEILQANIGNILLQF